MKRLLLLSAALLVACGGEPDTASGTSEPAADLVFAHLASDLPVDPAITYGKLENGMRYALRENDTPSDTASLLFHFDAGSLDETDSTRGIAHFLEHMAFNGSTQYPEGEMVKSLERLGLAFGADTNAYTSYDRTVYTLSLPNLSEEVVEASLGVMRETASELLLDPAAIEAERGVIQSERRARKSPASEAGEASLEFWLDGTTFPERSPIGTESTIDSVQAADFRTFYQGRYRPENATLVMVGDFDIPEMEARIRDTFSDWQATGEALPISRPTYVPDREPREGQFIDPEVTLSLDAAITRPLTKRPDTQANRRDDVLDSIGNALLNRRFSRLSREGTRDFIGAGAYTEEVFDIAEITGLSVSATPEDWQSALGDAVVELNKARRFCFTQSELDEYLANTRRGYERAVETADTRRTGGLANAILSGLTSDRVVTTPESSLARFEAILPDMTLEEVCPRFSAKWEGFKDADIFFTGPRAPGADVRDAFNAALSRPVEADAETASKPFAYTQWGEPGEVVDRRDVEDIDFTSVAFGNGVSLKVKSTDYAKDQVSVRVAIPGGLQVTDWPEGITDVASTVIRNSGLGQHTSDELRTILAGRSASVGTSLGADTVTLSGGSSLEDMPLMFDLLMASLTDPAYRAEPVATFRRSLESFYDTLDSTPGGVAARDVPRILRSGDTRFGIPSKQILTSLDESDVEALVAPLLENGPLEVTVVGDVDVDAVIAEVTRTLGTLPQRAVKPESPPAAATRLRFPAPDSVTLTHEGEAGTASYQLFIPALDYADTTRARPLGIARRIAQLKLTDVLREREGQSYSPNVGAYTPRNWPDYGYISVSVNADPAELDAIHDLVEEVMADMQAGNITEDEFERAITPVRESNRRALEQNGYWLGVLSNSRQKPWQLDDHRTRIKAYQDMTLADVQPIAREAFDTSRAYQIRIIPEG